MCLSMFVVIGVTFFRREFSKLGEVRSLIPYHVKMMVRLETC